MAPGVDKSVTGRNVRILLSHTPMQLRNASHFGTQTRLVDQSKQRQSQKTSDSQSSPGQRKTGSRSTNGGRGFDSVSSAQPAERVPGSVGHREARHEQARAGPASCAGAQTTAYEGPASGGADAHLVAFSVGEHPPVRGVLVGEESAPGCLHGVDSCRSVGDGHI